MKLGMLRRALWVGVLGASLAGVACRRDQVEGIGQMTIATTWLNRTLREELTSSVASHVNRIMEDRLRGRQFMAETAAGDAIGNVTVRSVSTECLLSHRPQLSIDPLFYRTSLEGTDLHVSGSFSVTIPDLLDGYSSPFMLLTTVRTNESWIVDETLIAYGIAGQLNGTFELYIDTLTNNLFRADFEIRGGRLHYESAHVLPISLQELESAQPSPYRIRGLESIHQEAIFRGFGTSFCTTLTNRAVVWF